MHEQRDFTPINKLPDEVLLRVFSILVTWDATYNGHWDTKGRLRNNDKRVCQGRDTHATIISQVNTSWRHLVLNTSLFWSHIDVSFEHGYWLPLSASSRQCLGRVKDAPIELHINCGQMPSSYTVGVTIPNYLRGKKVTSLILTTPNSAVIQPMVGAYLNEDTQSHLTQLKVESLSRDSSAACVPVPAQINREQLAQNLLQLGTLRLWRTTMDWAGVRLSRLVDLQLHSVRPSPSMDQIYDMLAASPELYTLELEWLHVQSYDFTESRSNTRIKLPRLRFLSLGHGDYIFANRFLEVIEPGAGQLCLQLLINGGSSRDLASIPIWPNITTLSLRMPYLHIELLIQLLPSLKALTTLLLDDIHISDFGVAHTDLQRIILKLCEVSLTGLRRIASIPSVNSLWLENCMYTPPDRSTPNCGELPEQELSWLEETVPDLYVDYAHYGKMRSSLPWWLQ